jgi:hypothetical protein
MKIPTNVPLALLLLVFIPSARLLAQDDASNIVPWAITGSWNIVEGSYKGSNYGGTVDITTGKDAFNFHWSVGESEYVGVGLGLGGWVGVGYGSEGRRGVAIYQILSDSTLEGSWVTSGDDFPIGHEMARGARLSRNKGTFKVEGTNPGTSSAYTGTLAFTRKGDVYDIVWKIGKDTFRGVGIRQDNVLVVGWGVSTEDLGVVAYKFDLDNGKGKWAIPGGTVLGIENLKRRQAGATPGR